MFLRYCHIGNRIKSRRCTKFRLPNNVNHRMACKRFLQFLLGVLNLFLLLLGLAMIGYGIYMVSAYNSSSLASFILSDTNSIKYEVPPISIDDERILSKTSLSLPSSHDYPPSALAPDNREVSPLQRDDSRRQEQPRKIVSPKFQYLELLSASSIWDNLPAAWFLDAILFLGAIITLIACSGYIAASTVYISCLQCYSLFVLLVMLLEVAVASFMFLNESWQKVIPNDSTGQLNILEEFIENRLNIFKWIALGVLILQVLALFLAVILLAISSTAGRYYDSDDDHLSPNIHDPPFLNWEPNKDRNPTAGT